MATLHASFKLRGNLGNLSYYVDRNGRNIVRSKGGPSRNRVLKDRNFERTRESCADFGSASSVAASIRRAFMPYLKWTSESDYFNRLVGLVRLIQTTDQTNVRGTKSILSGNVYLLEDFEFNANRHLTKALDTSIDSYIDKATGNTIVSFSSFVPLTAITAPPGATHFQLIAQAVTLDTDEERAAKAYQIGPFLPINSSETGIIELEIKPNAKEEGMLAVAAGILFYKEEMEVPLTMRDGALSIISIERINPENAEQQTVSGQSETAQQPVAKKAGQRSDQPLEIFLTNLVHETLPRNLSESQQAFYNEKLRKLQLTRWQNKLNKYRRG